MANIMQSENIVDIQGILISTDLKPGNFVRDGQTINTLGGTIVVRVDQEINGKKVVSDIPIHMFSAEFTRKGTVNPAYTSIQTVMNDFVSVAAIGDIEKADKVTLTGEIRMNEYTGSDGKQKSFPRIHASFVRRVVGEFEPKAEFETTFAVLTREEEKDREGKETGRYIVKGAIMQYGDRADVVPFIVCSDSAINFVSTYWDEGSTVKATGKLNFTSRKETVVTEVDFGEPMKKEKTISVSDLIITGGSNPIEGETAYTDKQIEEALAARLAFIEKNNAKKTAQTTPTKTTFNRSNLGF